VLLTLLATRRYGFVWETTLLAAEPFIAMTQALGALPALLGFAVPDPAMIRASGDTAPALAMTRQAWASWLLGVVLVYGVLPRLLLAGVCLWRWRQGREHLALDTNLPGYMPLRDRLMPNSERLGVQDDAPDTLPQFKAEPSLIENAGALLVGVELDDQRPWPPSLPANVADAGVLDSRESRHRLLEQLGRFPPARLAIALDPERSPDRGSLALLAELARNAGSTRIWLLPAAADQPRDERRLNDWCEALDRLGLPYADTLPLAWLEHAHD